MTLPIELYVRVFSQLYLGDLFNAKLISGYFNMMITKFEYNGELKLRKKFLVELLPNNITSISIYCRIEGITRFTNLHSLNLSDNEKVDDKDIFEFRKLKHLQTITLTNTNITDMGVNNLQRIESLTDINISRCEITDESMFYLASMNHLRKLNISYCSKIKNIGIKYLQNSNSLLIVKFRHEECNLDLYQFNRMKMLRYLNVSHLSSFVDFIKLEKLKIRLIVLYQSSIDQLNKLINLREFNILANVLESDLELTINLPKLEKIVIYTDKEDLHKINIRVKKNTKKLKTIIMDRCPLNEDNMRSLIKCTNLQKMRFYGSEDLSGTYLLKELKRLKNLVIVNNTGKIEEENVINICNVNSLQKLQLIWLTDEELIHIPRLRNLRQLTLYDHHINGEGLRYLKRCHKLEVLKIQYNSNVTEKWSSRFNQLTNIHGLKIFYGIHTI